MIKKQYAGGKDARQAIIEVADLVGRYLGNTLGPAGRNYFLPQGITNDGKTIVSEIRFPEEVKDQAALAFHEVARQQDKDAGDGTTTALVVATTLTKDLLAQVPDISVPIGKSVLDLGRQLEEEKDKALKILETKKIDVDSCETLYKVALTSMENEEAAKIISELMWEAGKDSYPILEYGFNEKIEKDVIKGVRWPLAIAHSGMLNNGKIAEYSNASVLVVNHVFDQYLELVPFMLSMLQNPQKPGALVIVAKQFSVPFVASIHDVSKAAKMPIVLVSANFHQDTFEDIASYVDARCVDTHPKTGNKITDVTFKDAGLCKKFIATEKESSFIGGRGLDALVSNDKGFNTRVGARVEEINKAKELVKDESERKQMDKRTSALLGGIATIYVDAKTVAERYYLKLKAEDAINSCKAALSEGMVQGGGLTLKAIADELGEGSLLANALTEPYRRIRQNNGGLELDTTNVFDSYLVAKANIENPVSIVKTLATIEGIIADVEHDVVDELANKLRG